MKNYAIGILLMGLYFLLCTSMTSSSSTLAKEYEKLERSRKRSEIQKKIEAFLTQDHVKQIDSKFQQGEKT